MKKSLLFVVAAVLLLGACACCETMDKGKIKRDADNSFKSMDNGNVK